MRSAIPRTHTCLVGAVVALSLRAPVAGQDRVFVDQYMPLRSELMLADANGDNPRKLLPGSEIDYNASFSFDGEWVVFTSDRYGSADIFRVRADGTGLERLTDSPSFDDQGVLSPDNRSLAFVSTRGDGSADIYIMDLRSQEVRNLTSSPGGDFRPSWSPDGRTIAFSSDRGTGFPHQGYPGPAGRWEHVHATSIYLVRADGTGLRRLTTDPEMMTGSPKWSRDGARIVFYEMPVRRTSQSARGGASNIVSLDVATGERIVHAAGAGLKVSPQFLTTDGVAYLTKSPLSSTLDFTDGRDSSAPEDILNPSWSRDGARVVYHAGQQASMHHYSNSPGTAVLSAIDGTGFELMHASGFPAVSPDGRTLAVTERTPSGDRMAVVLWNTDGTNPRRVYSDDVTVMGLSWSPDGRWLAFGAGGFFEFRTIEPAQILIMKADGSEVRQVTKGPGNAGFPTWSPDGAQIVYRFWTDDEQGEGLRIVEVATGESRVLTKEYDTLPVWSPRGDVIMFTRFAHDDRFRYDDFDIYTIRPDGTDVKRLTYSEGNDAHSLWSPDGRQIIWSSSRFGFKDESPLHINQPQPYAELFIMNADGSDQRPLTDNQYEEGTPAWVPSTGGSPSGIR